MGWRWYCRPRNKIRDGISMFVSFVIENREHEQHTNDNLARLRGENFDAPRKRQYSGTGEVIRKTYRMSRGSAVVSYKYVAQWFKNVIESANRVDLDSQPVRTYLPSLI
jgi:hypothetical protein